MQKSPRHLLVVEDEPGLSQLICHGLSQAGFQPQAALDGETALALYGAQKPDAILLDVFLPGIDGFQFCRQIRDELGDATTPIIMLTGADDVSSISQAFEFGATDFLTKPINLPLLVERVRYALRNRDNELSLKKALYFQGRAGQLAKLGYWAFDYTTGEFVLNPHARGLLHLESRDYGRDEILDLVHPDDRARAEVVLAEQREAELEIRMQLADVGERIIRVSASMDESDGSVIHGAFQDISEQRSTEDLLGFLRLHDDLTGLPNEKLLLRHLDELERVKLGASNQVVLSKFGILRYGRLVEVFGQPRVDALIKQISNDLTRRIRELHGRANLYYLNGGRFAVLSRFSHTQETEVELMHLVALVEQERNIRQESITPSAVCSAMLLEEDRLTSDVVYQRVRLALHRAESSPGEGVYWYQKATHGDLHRELEIEQAVKRAVSDNRFELYLQPQIAVQSDRVWGFEALIRWVDETGRVGQYTPGEFLPAVERLGLMTQLGYQIIDKAFAKAQALQQAGLAVRLGINLAAQQFNDDRLVSYILSSLESSGLSADAIEFEITESTAMADPEVTLLKLKALRNAGFHLAIDDFGVGYSSMEYLLRFPLTTLKIDRAFVTDITTNTEVRAIVKAIQALASGLGLHTVAEGIENGRQSDYLDALGVDVLQGFHYAKALPLDDAIAFARGFSGDRV
ncbi:MAG: EAL domain-containing response regulator [Saccharospirillum sp.]